MDIGLTNFNHIYEFVPVNKHMKVREKNPNPPCEKKSKKMASNCSLRVLDINYVTHGRKRVKYSSFLIAANLFSSFIASKVSYMRLLRNAL